MTFTSPISLFVAVLIAIALFILAWIRRPAIPRASAALAMAGVIALALAAGGISCRSGREAKIAVLVDCSPSVRGASFRDPKWLRTRVHELLGSRSFDLYAFADTSGKLGEADHPVEMPADHTTLAAPSTDAVLLFSDGRFDTPSVTSPIYAVVDPALASPSDASIVTLEQRDGELAADVRNTGSPRELTWANGKRQSTTAPTGSTILSTQLQTMAETITARLSPNDLWPENDALSIRPSPPIASQKWWIGDSPPAGWMGIAPANLPLETSAWLGPAIVVLSDVSADDLSPPQQDRLVQYVRDLGGAIVIAGGEHAFAAGHYPGSELETLSPLSSSPPEPVTHWVLLVDSSGSMSSPAGASTRFNFAADALVTVLRELPKSDLVSIGNFAKQLRWWSIAKRVQDTALQSLPPADVQPSGPTNLDAALQQIISSLPASPPIDLLVISDAKAEFPDVDKLAEALKDHHVRLSALVIGAGVANSALAKLVIVSGGHLVTDAESQNWTQDVRRTLRAVMPDRLISESATVSFDGILKSLPPREVSTMNRTWIKQSATALARASVGTEKLPAGARWTIGTGDVVSLGFSPGAGEIAGIEKVIARRPRDPRFSVAWHNGSTLHVRIGARDRDAFLNDQRLTLDLGPGSRTPIPQTAPGRYEIDLPSPRSPATASILHDDQLLDRFAIAGRYAREFDAIGNDLDALRAVCDRSGGRIIQPDDHRLIQFPDTRQIHSMALLFALLGGLCIGASLIVWRIS